MNKRSLHQLITQALQSRYETAVSAAKQAYETATHEENVAENKYDTLGLEASYLAEGQARRTQEAEAALKRFESLNIKYFSEDDAIQYGAWVRLREQSSQTLLEVFLSPVAGGLSVEADSQTILLISDQAPLGKALLGLYLDDEVQIGDKLYVIEQLA